MSLFQEWKAKLWEEFWVPQLPGGWRETSIWTVLHAGNIGMLISVASGIPHRFPEASRAVGFGCIGLSIGTIIYAYVDYWKRFKHQKITTHSADLIYVCYDFLNELITRQDCLEKVSSLVNARFEKDAYKGLEVVYMYLKNNASDLLAEPLFDPLFGDQDPRMICIELDKTLDPTGTLSLLQASYDTVPQGIQTRIQEFLAKRKSVCDIYRQDLMAAAWHPKRVEAWIRQDRWDLLY